MQYLTKEHILSKVDERTLFEYYFETKIIIKANIYRNPFRTDKSPGSCHFNWYRNKFIFFDKANSDQIDVFTYLQKKYDLTYKGALEKINKDFRLRLSVIEPTKNIPLSPVPGNAGVYYEIEKGFKSEFKIITRKFTKNDGYYWKPYNITVKILKKFNVRAIKSAYVSSDLKNFRILYKEDRQDPCYGYFNDLTDEVQLYRPLVKDKFFKWRHNLSEDVIHGYDCLPRTGDLLFITSSRKDAMVLDSLGYNAVAPRSELAKLPIDKLRELKQRFKEVVLFLDSDQPGRKGSIKYSILYGIPYILLDTAKDISDYIVDYKPRQTKIKIERELSNLRTCMIKSY